MHTQGVACHIHLLAQVALCAVGHEGLIAGHIQSKDPSVELSFLGCEPCCLDSRLRQSVELLLVGDMQGEGFCLLQQVLRELQGEHAGLLAELAQPFFSLIVEQCTTANVAIVAVVEQTFLLGCQSAMRAMNGLDAFEETAVEPNVIGMLGQDGLHLLRQGVHFIISLSREHIEKHVRDALQQVVVALRFVVAVDDGVVESGFFGVVDGFLYLFVVTTDTLHEGFLEVFYAYLVERHGFMRCVVMLEKRIFPCFFHDC